MGTRIREPSVASQASRGEPAIARVRSFGEVAMGKVWVLDTETKGTGAEMVPLEKVLRGPEAAPERPFAFPSPKRRPEPEPEPKQPPRFRVVDVMTGEALVEDAPIRATVDRLADVRSVVDVTIDVWDPHTESWHKLNHGERKRLWSLRGTPRSRP